MPRKAGRVPCRLPSMMLERRYTTYFPGWEIIRSLQGHDQPSPDAIKDVKWKLQGIWRKHVGSPMMALINEMNPVIRGWCHYFRIGVSKEVFNDLDRFMYTRARHYMKRRHPRQSGWWRTEKYWGRTLGRQDRWVFQDKTRNGTLRKFAWTKIVQHRLVPTPYSPDDSTLEDYWRQ